jgi:hypothetical protein
LRERGWGSPKKNSDEGTYTVVLCIYKYFVVQIYSLLGGEFAQDSASAFAILMFMQAASSACAFAYSSKIWLWWQLLIGIAAENISQRRQSKNLKIPATGICGNCVPRLFSWVWASNFVGSGSEYRTVSELIC